MTEPKVYDAKGNRLEVGDRVSRLFASGRTGGVVGEISQIDEEGDVCVSWPRIPCGPLLVERRYPLRRPLLRSYRCNDLELIKDTKEENGG